MNPVVFLADATDEADLEAVFTHLHRLGGNGRRCHPADFSFLLEGGRVLPLVQGHPLSASLVVGWVFEDWLVPGMALLEMLEAAGVQVLNRGPVLFRGQNKAVMSAALQRAGVPHEPVCFSLDPEFTSAWTREASFPQVAKPGLVVCGGRTVCTSGRGVVRLDDPGALAAVHGSLSNVGQPLYTQRYVERPSNRDIRLWVFGYEPVRACLKTPPRGEWVTNMHRGASQREYPLDPDLVDIGRRAARAIGAEIAGIDLAEHSEGGYTVLEVNTCPTFLRASAVFGDVVPEALARFVLGVARGRHSPGGCQPEQG